MCIELREGLYLPDTRYLDLDLTCALTGGSEFVVVGCVEVRVRLGLYSRVMSLPPLAMTLRWNEEGCCAAVTALFLCLPGTGCHPVTIHVHLSSWPVPHCGGMHGEGLGLCLA